LEDSASAAGDLLSTGQDVLKAVADFIPGTGFINVGLSLVNSTSKLLNGLASSPVAGDIFERLSVFEPFGTYVFISEEGSFSYLNSSRDIMNELGPAKLMKEKVNAEGILSHDNIRQHDIIQYILSLQGEQGATFLSQHCFSQSCDPVQPSPAQLSSAQEHFNVAVENMRVMPQTDCLAYFVQGKNLDFIGLDLRMP
jgi:hypothetical protein